MTELYSQFSLFQELLSATTEALGGFFSAFVLSNDELQRQLLSTQASLASTLTIFDSQGNEIIGNNEKILATTDAMAKAMRQIEKDTNDIVGVTTEDVNSTFQLLIANAGKFIGQSKEFTDPIEAVTASTKNWVAAMGAIGIEADQARFEINAILNGDLGNPDADLARRLNITQQEYDLWKANGELIDQINGRLEVYVEGNKLAARSIAGVGSNLQSFFEDTARIAGQPLMDPIIDSLFSVYNVLNDNRALIEKELTGNIKQIGDLITLIQKRVFELGDATGLTFEQAVKLGADGFGAVLDFVVPIVDIVFQIGKVLAPIVTQIVTQTVGIVQFAADGLAKIANEVEELANLINAVTQFLFGWILPINESGEAIGGVVEVLNIIREYVGYITGETWEAMEALQTFISTTDQILGQSAQVTGRAQESLAAARDAAKTGGELSEQQRKSAEATNLLINSQIQALQEQKEKQEELNLVRAGDREARDANLKLIDAEIANLQALGSELANATGQDISFGTKPLKDLGDATQALQQQVSALNNTYQEDGLGDREAFNEAADGVTELMARQVEFGQLTNEQAQEQLAAISQNTKVELDTRIAAIDQLSDLSQQQSDRRVAQIENEIGEITAKERDGSLSRIEALEQVSEAEQKITQARLDSLAERIQAEQELGRNTASLEAEEIALKQELEGQKVQAARDAFDLEVELAQQKTDKILAQSQLAETQRLTQTQELLNQGLISEEEANSQRAQSTVERVNAELAAEQAKLAELEALTPPSDEEGRIEYENQLQEARQKTADLTLNSLEAQLDAENAIEEAVNAQLELKQREIDLELSQDNLALSKEELEIQKQVTAGAVSREEAEVRIRDISRKRLEEELSAEKAKLAQLEQVQFNTEEERIAAEQDIADARQGIIEKEIELQAKIQEAALLANGGALTAEEKQRKAILDQIDDQIAGIERSQALEQAKQDILQRQADFRQAMLDLQAQANDLDGRAIDLVLQEAEAREDALESYNDAVEENANVQEESQQKVLDLEAKRGQLLSDISNSSSGADRVAKARELQQLEEDIKKEREEAEEQRVEAQRKEQATARQLAILGIDAEEDQAALAEARHEAERQALAQQFEQRQLELDSQRLQVETAKEGERIAANRAVAEANLARLQAERQQIQAQADLKAAQTLGDTEAARVAQIELEAARNQLEIADLQTDAAEEQLENQLKLADAQTQLIDREQQILNNERTVEERALRGRQAYERIMAGGPVEVPTDLVVPQDALQEKLDFTPDLGVGFEGGQVDLGSQADKSLTDTAAATREVAVASRDNADKQDQIIALLQNGLKVNTHLDSTVNVDVQVDGNGQGTNTVEEMISSRKCGK